MLLQWMTAAAVVAAEQLHWWRHYYLARLPSLHQPGRGRSGSHTHITGIYRQGHPPLTAGKSTWQSLTNKWDKITTHLYTSFWVMQLINADDTLHAHCCLPPVAFPWISNNTSSKESSRVCF